MKRSDSRFSVVNEPFGQGRDSFRCIFDFGTMLSCFRPNAGNRRVLDFCAGSGWISEWLNRLGFEVTAIDINSDVANVLRLRLENDLRLDIQKLNFVHGDGCELPFKDRSFGHICSFDSLHHMRDYPRVMSELFRVLSFDGRLIFVEPGAKHSSSKETLEFIRDYKTHDSTWIERDVILEEIFDIAIACGFSSVVVIPVLLPNLREYGFQTWERFRQGDQILEIDYLTVLKSFNYNDRIIFYLDKQEESIFSLWKKTMKFGQ